jgi:hypothetical protein
MDHCMTPEQFERLCQLQTEGMKRANEYLAEEWSKILYSIPPNKTESTPLSKVIMD